MKITGSFLQQTSTEIEQNNLFFKPKVAWIAKAGCLFGKY